MNGWQRIQAVATGQLPDRIPVFYNLFEQGATELGLTIREYYSNPENVAEGQLRLRRKYDYDNLWGSFYVAKEAEMFGCRRMIFADNGPPNVGHLVLQTLEDIERLEVPADVFSHPGFADTRRCLEILSRESAGQYPVFAFVTSSTSLPALLMGAEKWLELLICGPFSLRDELLRKCSLFVQRHIQACRQAGAQLCVYAAPFSTPGMLTPALCREIGYPWIINDLSQPGPADIVLHGGGLPLAPLLPELVGKLPLAACYLHPFDDIAACKQVIAGRALCAGTINDIRLLSWTPAEVETEVHRILDAGVPGGGFCFGTLVMPFEIPAANIRAMMNAVSRYCEQRRSRHAQD